VTRIVLFVDDEPIVLLGLKRALHKLCGHWTVLTATSASEALALLATQDVDAVVTDLTMPCMDGAELLRRVMRQHPATVRFLLSGYSEQELMGSALAPAHQFFTKPFEEKRLVAALDQAMDARAYVTNQLVLDSIGFPALPDISRRLALELDRGAADIDDIASIIMLDEPMTAAIVAHANALQGDARQYAETPTQAVRALGVNVIQGVILFLHLFERFEFLGVRSYSLPMLKRHCLRTACIAREIAKDMCLESEAVGATYSAALLHDVGKLLLDVLYATQCQAVMREVRTNNRMISDVESEYLGLTHAQVGAYLLGLFGLPEPVVNAVARHHVGTPGHTRFLAEDAVYFANVIEHELFVFNETYARPEPDPARVRALGLEQRLAKWKRTTLGLGLDPLSGA